VLDVLTEVRAGLLHSAKVVTQPTQVMDDVGAVPEEAGVELPVGRARYRSLDPVVESVQRVDLARLDCAVQQPGDGAHEHEAAENGSEEEHPGHDQCVAVERPARELRRTRSQEGRELRDRGEGQDHAAERHRRTQQEQVHQLHGREADPARGADVPRGDPLVVHVGPLRGRAVPALAIGHGLSGVQGGGVPQLGAVTQ
jgi:hypothetical protein